MDEPLPQAGAVSARPQGCPSAASPSLTSRPHRAVESRGLCQKKRLAFSPFQDNNLRRLPSSQYRPWTRRIGEGDFVPALDALESHSSQQSACQMEAPCLRRNPIMHLATIVVTSKSAYRSAMSPRLPVANRVQPPDRRFYRPAP